MADSRSFATVRERVVRMPEYRSNSRYSPSADLEQCQGRVSVRMCRLTWIVLGCHWHTRLTCSVTCRHLRIGLRREPGSVLLQLIHLVGRHVRCMALRWLHHTTQILYGRRESCLIVECETQLDGCIPHTERRMSTFFQHSSRYLLTF